MNPGLKPGDKLGNFEVTERLAVGGMGLIWKGYDRLLARHVAIKQIAAVGSVDESFRERFRKEAIIQKRLTGSQKRLVEIYDFIDEERGLFIVMEFIQGLSLDQVLAKVNGPIPARQSLIVINEIAEGLAHLHKAGVIHRDLKPSNVMVADKGGVKICDFGMASLMDSQESMPFGTAQYMAPELFRGEPADARADIYSLGMMAYEMLCGRPAFDETFKAITRDTRQQSLRWMKWHTNQRIVAPVISKVNPTIPEVLDELVGRMMSKDPTQRIASADQVRTAIMRHFSGQSPTEPAMDPAPGKAAAPQGSDHATAPLPKKKKLPLILACVTLVLACGIGGYIWIENNKAAQLVEKQQTELLNIFRKGQQSFQANDWQSAHDAFADLFSKLEEGNRLVGDTEAYLMLSQARLKQKEAEQKLRDRDLAACMEAYASAQKLVETVMNPKRATPEGLRSIGSQLGKQLVDRAAWIGFFQARDQEIKAGKIDAARREWRRMEPSLSQATIDEKAAFADIGNRLAAMRNQSEVANILEEVDQLTKARSFNEALKLLNERLDEDRFSKVVELRQRRSELINVMEYDRAVAQAAELERGGKYAEAVALLEKALAINFNVMLKGKIAELNARYYLDLGIKARAAGEPTAVDHFNKSIGYFKTPEAEQALKELGAEAAMSSLRNQFNEAFGAKQWENVILLGKQVLSAGPDADATTKITIAQVRVYVRDARQLLGNNKPEDISAALDLLDRAIALSDADTEARGLVVEATGLSKYHELLAEARKLRASDKIGAAMSKLREVEKHIETSKINVSVDSVVSLRKEYEFDLDVQQAAQYMQLKQYPAAKAKIDSLISRNAEDKRALELKKQYDEEAPQ